MVSFVNPHTLVVRSAFSKKKEKEKEKKKLTYFFTSFLYQTIELDPNPLNTLVVP
jgi:hypothetical protein